MEILSDQRLVRRIRKANSELAAGRAEDLGKGEALALARRKS